jgi:ferredoxin
MVQTLHSVNPDTCRGDGICVEICPEDALELVDGKAATAEERADSCILCGQCVAVCPTESLEMPSLPVERFQRLPPMPFGCDEFTDFLRLRRSVRVFRDMPVERELTEKILEAAATAPMGFPPHSTGIVVIEGREERDLLLHELVSSYAAMLKRFSHPVGRAMVRLFAGAENFHALKTHILDMARHANEIYRRDGSDGYMRGAPMVMLFHGDRRALSYEENAHLVCHHAMLAAHSLGLGTTIIGLIPPIVERSNPLRDRYGIPRENRVLTSLVVGHPKYRYRRGIHRELASVRIL